MSEPSSRPAEAGGRARIRLLLATGLGAGLAPVAPGTAGALVGLLLFAASRHLGGVAAAAVATLLFTALGWWSAGAAARHYGEEDPGRVVVDEIAGQMLALLFLPPTVATYAAGFFCFRLLDVIKPPPARRFESLPGASGIMADDLVAGLYTNIALRLLGWGVPGVLGWA